MTDKHHCYMKDLNNHISAMLAKITDISSKTDEQEEKLTEISPKLTTYEDRLEKLSITKIHIQPLSLQITSISSKLSAYENRLDKMSIANITKFGTTMKENEDILNTNIDTKIDEFKDEASISINKTLYPLNPINSTSSYNQPSADINKLPLLKSPDYHSHASQLTKHISPVTLEGDTLIQLQKWWEAICSDF